MVNHIDALSLQSPSRQEKKKGKRQKIFRRRELNPGSERPNRRMRVSNASHYTTTELDIKSIMSH